MPNSDRRQLVNPWGHRDNGHLNDSADHCLAYANFSQKSVGADTYALMAHQLAIVIAAAHALDDRRSDAKRSPLRAIVAMRQVASRWRFVRIQSERLTSIK
jgi:hypothetical protein